MFYSASIQVTEVRHLRCSTPASLSKQGWKYDQRASRSCLSKWRAQEWTERANCVCQNGVRGFSVLSLSNPGGGRPSWCTTRWQTCHRASSVAGEKSEGRVTDWCRRAWTLPWGCIGDHGVRRVFYMIQMILDGLVPLDPAERARCSMEEDENIRRAWDLTSLPLAFSTS